MFGTNYDLEMAKGFVTSESLKNNFVSFPHFQIMLFYFALHHCMLS